MSEKITIGVEDVERDDVRALLQTVATWDEDLYPPESRHGLDLDAYRRPEVTLLVARAGGVAVGCAAYQLQAEDSAELKSMFVVPDARGRGIAQALLATIEAVLRGRVTVLRLETGIKQPAAVRLYERAGFRRRGPFGSYRDDSLSVFMEKAL